MNDSVDDEEERSVINVKLLHQSGVGICIPTTIKKKKSNYQLGHKLIYDESDTAYTIIITMDHNKVKKKMDSRFTTLYIF